MVIPTNSKPNPVFRVLIYAIILAGIFIALSIMFPGAISAILDALWLLLLLAVIIFFTLGILVVVGLRKEANRILEILMEGSLSIVDFLAFLKLVWLRFLEVLREFILYAAPFVAFVLCWFVYLLVLYVYKTYGKNHDITFFTIALTAFMVLFIGRLNKPKTKEVDLTEWSNKVKLAFKSAFIDGFEVVLFVFFLTMDSTKLFFLPAHLNILLHAEFKGYDFMVRSFVNDGHLLVTTNIIIFAITVEIVRNILKIIAVARKHYVNDILLFSDGIIAPRSTRIKKALRKSFAEAKDDMVKFITFTTVLFAVFLVFPRLKLLTLAVASVTSLILDVIMTDRLFSKGGKDLISRVLSKLFKV